MYKVKMSHYGHGQAIKSNFLRRSRIDGHAKKSIFFIFAQNIPFGKLLREKIVLVSSNLFFGRNLKSSKNAHLG